jgi:hypothetical protein
MSPYDVGSVWGPAKSNATTALPFPEAFLKVSIAA